MLQVEYESSIVVVLDFTYTDAANKYSLRFEFGLTIYGVALSIANAGILFGYTIVVDCFNLPYIRVPVNLCVRK